MNWRLALGFLFAPVLPSIVAAIVMGAITSNSVNTWSGVLIFLTFAEAICILIAVPVYLLVSRFIKVNLGICLLTGTVIGLFGGLIGLFIGILSAALFWVVAIRPPALKRAVRGGQG